MLSKQEFARWVEASHALFDLFDGKYDAYPFARKLAAQWLRRGEFTLDEEARRGLADSIRNFKYNVFGLGPRMRERIEPELWALLEAMEADRRNAGYAISIYFFTWNVRRFVEYIGKNSYFSIVKYFESLGAKLEEMRNSLAHFADKHILRDEVEDKEIVNLFNRANQALKALGIGKNEPVATAKLLHIFSPSYFPLIDNPIADCTGIKKIDAYTYTEWIHTLKNWLKNYTEEALQLEKNTGHTILKLVDEGLYTMCSITLKARIHSLGLPSKQPTLPRKTKHRKHRKRRRR